MQSNICKGVISFILAFLYCAVFAQTDNTILLNGAWRFKIDRADKGISEHWYNLSYAETVRLPGSMAENGKGDNPSLTTPWMGSIWDSSWYYNPAMAKYRQPGNMKFPFWLTPEKYYLGAAWYQKDVFIPKTWTGKHIVLTLERPHWQTTVWVDSVLVGKQNSLSTAHCYNLSVLLSEGRHRITVCVDNRTNNIDPGNNSHSISDHTQGNWNGMVGALRLDAGPAVWADDIQVYPDIQNKSIKIRAYLKKQGRKQIGSLKFSVLTKPVSAKIMAVPVASSALIKFDITRDTLIETTIDLGKKMQLWDEFAPNLYSLKTELTANEGGKESKLTIFGMREFSTSGSQFTINGRFVFLRGTVECCVFPLSGYPPTDETSWANIFSTCKNYGLNHMRFHSYCPPEAAFEAADKAGFYLQVEAPSWPNYTTALGAGKPIDDYIFAESQRIVKQYGNHPSFCMLASGNEPSKATNYIAYLDTFVSRWRRSDNRRVYTGASIGRGWKLNVVNDYVVRAGARGLDWKRDLPNTCFDYSDRLEDIKIPYVTHEMGQWCAFPNFNEIKKYTGVYSAGNFEIFRNTFVDNKLGGKDADFLKSSGKLQTLCYKMEIEATLRTKDFGGFQLLGLTDFPGQGTALVGVLDAFWQSKGYVSDMQFRAFCGATVPLARFQKAVYQNDEYFMAEVEVAHYGSKPLNKVTPKWRIRNSAGELVDSGKLATTNIAIGNCQPLGQVAVRLKHIREAAAFTFEVSVDKFTNTWNFWVYPAWGDYIDSCDAYVCSRPDSRMEGILKRGGNVLLLAGGNIENGKDVIQYFTPVFWNTSWFKMRPPHTTGVFIDTLHPVFKYFPTRSFGDLQWYELLQKQQVMDVDSFPSDFKTIVQPIDTWFLNRRLALLFEAKVYAGKVMVCSADLSTDPDNRIAARQLLRSIRQYMQSSEFNPSQELEYKQITELFERKVRKGWDSYTREVPDELRKAK